MLRFANGICIHKIITLSFSFIFILSFVDIFIGKNLMAIKKA